MIAAFTISAIINFILALAVFYMRLKNQDLEEDNMNKERTMKHLEGQIEFLSSTHPKPKDREY